MDVQVIARHRVGETQVHRFQFDPVPYAVVDRSSDRRRPVQHVPDDRMAQVGQVGPQLVGPAGLEPKFQQGVAALFSDDCPVGPGHLPSLGHWDVPPSTANRWVPPQRHVDQPTSPGNPPLNHGVVDPDHLVPFKKPLQSFADVGIQGEHHQTSRRAVQPMSR